MTSEGQSQCQRVLAFLLSVHGCTYTICLSLSNCNYRFAILYMLLLVYNSTSAEVMWPRSVIHLMYLPFKDYMMMQIWMWKMEKQGLSVIETIMVCATDSWGVPAAKFMNYSNIQGLAEKMIKNVQYCRINWWNTIASMKWLCFHLQVFYISYSM